MRILLLLCFFILPGCGKKDRDTTSPLKGMDTFQVIIFMPSKENIQESFSNSLIESFKKFGHVEMANAKENFVTSKNSLPVLLLSIDSYEEKKGSMQVIAEVEVSANRFKTAASIWKLDSSTFLNLPVPVEHKEGIAFERPRPGENPQFEAVFSQMIVEFTKEYNHDNPKRQKPTFIIQQSL